MSGRATRSGKRVAKARRALRAGVRPSARPRTSTLATRTFKSRSPWQGGFAINRLGPTWTITSLNIGVPGSFEAYSDTTNVPAVGNSTFSIGTAVQVNGYGTTGQYNVPFALNFSLDSIAQYTDIQNISDRYKIDKVKVTFWCAQTQAVANDPDVRAITPQAITAMPTIRWDEDRDDTQVGTVQAFKARMNSKVGNMANGRRITCWVTPVPAPTVYTAVTGGAYSVPSAPLYINTAYPGVPHYGLKGIFENVQGAIADPAGQVYNVGVNIMCETVYYISARDLV